MEEKGRRGRKGGGGEREEGEEGRRGRKGGGGERKEGEGS